MSQPSTFASHLLATVTGGSSKATSVPATPPTDRLKWELVPPIKPHFEGGGGTTGGGGATASW